MKNLEGQCRPFVSLHGIAQNNQNYILVQISKIVTTGLFWADVK